MGLIRNADDFGKSESVNRAVMTCFEKSFIDRTTLMVNMDAAESAVGLARSAGFADRVGIHLNLTEGMPLTAPIRSNPLFCDETGRFNAQFRRHRSCRLHLSNETIIQIRTELKEQLKRFQAWGLPLMHADSHHHVHTDLPVFRVLQDLSKEYEFTSIRLSRNLYHGGSLPNAFYKKWYNAKVQKICRSTTDLFGSFPDLMAYAKKSELITLLNEYQIELMLHPLYDENGTLLDTEIPMEEVDRTLRELLS